MPRPPAPARLVVRLLEQAREPVFAFSDQRQILFVNEAASRWLGIDAVQLVGRVCNYQAAGGEEPLAAACAAICPPPEAFAGTARDGAISRLAAEQRPFERRGAQFIQLPGQNGSAGMLLAVAEPVGQTAGDLAGDRLAAERLHALLLRMRGDAGQRFHIDQLIGESAAISRVREQVRMAVQTRPRVLIVGPQGSGREHVARTIHYGRSSGSAGPLAPIACPLVNAEQMQAGLASLLRRQRESATEQPPTALLLDVDRLRPDAQHELAGFLRLPGIELQTLATARRLLPRLAEKVKFQKELALELSTLTIALPPLSKRREDIPLLAQHFLEEANSTRGSQLAGFQPAALELLAGLPWAGNLDELRRAVIEACDEAIGPRVAIAELPDWVHLAAGAAARPKRDEQPIDLDDFLAEIEKELLSRALRRARGNKSRAAQLLGLSRQRLLRRLVQHGLIAPAEADEPVVFEPLPEES
jgi:transcriptional regulator with PAS, ATPase and Fis domain